PMASKKTPAKAVKKAVGKAQSAKSAPAKPAAPKPVATVLNKTALVAHLSAVSGAAPKDVRNVLSALEATALGSLGKKGAGEFVLPGLLKVTSVKVPAKPKRKGINPFTKEEQWFAAKPASVKVKVRPLKKLRGAASL